MDDLWRVEFFTDRAGQPMIKVMSGAAEIFRLFAGQDDQAFSMCVWRNHALTGAWRAARRAA